MRIDLMKESNRVTHMFDKLRTEVLKYDNVLSVAMAVNLVTMNIEMIELFESIHGVYEQPIMLGGRRVGCVYKILGKRIVRNDTTPFGMVDFD